MFNDFGEHTAHKDISHFPQSIDKSWSVLPQGKYKYSIYHKIRKVFLWSDLTHHHSNIELVLFNQEKIDNYTTSYFGGAVEINEKGYRFISGNGHSSRINDSTGKELKKAINSGYKAEIINI